jgi:thioredoxin-like negative regulator of GroEL
MMPIVDGLEEEFAGEISVVRLDAADSANIALQEQYGLRGHPSFVVLGEDDVVVESYFGPQTEETLRAAIDQAIGP